VQKTILALAGFARHHLRLARAALDPVPPAAIPAFLPLAIVEPLLRRVERLGDAIVTENAGLSDLEILVRIGAARLRGIGGHRKGPLCEVGSFASRASRKGR
jgi:phytoene/squalene synthetase